MPAAEDRVRMTSSSPQTMANLRQRLRVRSLTDREDMGELVLGLVMLGVMGICLPGSLFLITDVVLSKLL